MIKKNQDYGQTIDNLEIQGKPAPYPVFNEREVRATAGLMFIVAFGTFMYVVLTRDFRPLNILIPLFFIDFLLKVLQGPDLSPFGFVGKRLVAHLEPEYVGAIQKRFAWTLGLLMASSMIFIALVFQIRGLIPLLFCGTCIVLMWMETSLGICVGCQIYGKLIDWKLIPEPEFRPACPGGACSINKIRPSK